MTDVGHRTEQEEQQDVWVCSWCGGDGWYADYCDECYRLGEHCGCEGQPRECVRCGGVGRGN